MLSFHFMKESQFYCNGETMKPSFAVPVSGVYPTILGSGAVGGVTGGLVGGGVGKAVMAACDDSPARGELAGVVAGATAGFVSGAVAGNLVMPGGGGIVLGGAAGGLVGAAAGKTATTLGCGAYPGQKIV